MDAKFKTFRVQAAAIASSSMATELIRGKTLDEALAVTNKAVAEALEEAPPELHCSVLAEEGIRKAIADYRARHGSPRRAEDNLMLTERERERYSGDSPLR